LKMCNLLGEEEPGGGTRQEGVSCRGGNSKVELRTIRGGHFRGGGEWFIGEGEK